MKMNGANGAAAAGVAGGITKADLERLIAAAKETAPAQTIRVETAPIKVVTDSEQPPYKRCDMKPYLKWTAISLGSVVAIAHIGVLGHLVRREPDRIQVPTINIPRGTPYSSYKIEAGKDGYTIEYKANDPAILESQSH